MFKQLSFTRMPATMQNSENIWQSLRYSNEKTQDIETAIMLDNHFKNFFRNALVLAITDVPL